MPLLITPPYCSKKIAIKFQVHAYIVTKLCNTTKPDTKMQSLASLPSLQMLGRPAGQVGFVGLHKLIQGFIPAWFLNSVVRLKWKDMSVARIALMISFLISCIAHQQRSALLLISRLFACNSLPAQCCNCCSRQAINPPGMVCLHMGQCCGGLRLQQFVPVCPEQK